MVCTFGDVTDVVWWRELGLPVRSILGPDGRLLDVPWGAARLGDGRPRLGATQLRRAARADGGVRAPADRRAARAVGRSGRRADTGHAGREVLREGDRPVEIITSRQWFIRTVDRREALLARGRELRWHPPYMRARYEDWIRGLSGDWCVSRQRFFGVPFPLWYPVDARGRDPLRGADPRGRAPGRPLERCSRGLRGRPARAARRLRRRSGRDGHLGDILAHPADRRPSRLGRGSVRAGLPDGPAAAGPRHHPDVAVSRPCCARNSNSESCPGATRRSRAGCWTPTARRCRSRRGTWSRRCTCSRSTAPTRSATGPRAGDRGRTRPLTPSR